ncbi:putative metallopeptidase [Azospirillum sp.]|uniref:putative metallopeptidase n=1 Tax=Azospirillum sp. TaxID=34012 RepID=UPI003D71DB35
MDDDGLRPEDAFTIAPDGENEPREILERLEKLDEFKHLREGEAVFLFLMRAETKIKQGRHILGEVGLPRFQGAYAPLAMWMLARMCGGIVPDFIMILDAGWWAYATPIKREALIYHELCHCVQATDKEGEPRFNDAGFPVWAIQGHDIEEFNAVARRYGAWEAGIQSFIEALRDGKAI